MTTQISEDEWGLIYFRKKAQFNQYAQFKSKSFQYQKLLGNLHFLSSEDDQNNKKQIKRFIKGLNNVLQQLKNIISQIHQEMKFLKLQNIASLIESFQELISSLHHYNIQDKKNKIEYERKQHGNEKDKLSQNCQKCLGSINQINLKKIYDQITTTEATNQSQNLKMTKQQRRKMISQLDEYDILIAEKQNYIRKVNTVLENKGKVGQLSNHDKTYNFLSEYLSTIQKIQQKRTKSYNKQNSGPQVDDTKWEQQSYKHILEYIKRVVFQHFVNECSGPVKKMFESINIDKIFKSYRDQAGAQMSEQRCAVMQNHETQTVSTNEIQQLKSIERRMQFKLKENSILKTNKDELEKKYILALDLNRKVQSELYDLKKQKKFLQSQLKIAQQNLKAITQKYNEKVKSFEGQQRKTFENYVNERQRILRVSKQLQTQFRVLQTEHKKCDSKKYKSKQITQLATQQTQTEDFQYDNAGNTQFMYKTDSFPFKKRKSALNKMLFASFKGQRKGGFFKDLENGTNLFEAFRKQSIVDEEQQESSTIITNLILQSGVLNLSINYLTDQNNQETQAKNKALRKQQKSQIRKDYKFNKSSRNKYLKTEPSLDFTDSKYLQQNQNSGLPLLEKDKRIKMSMTSFKKFPTQKTNLNEKDISNANYKFSKFNRLTELDNHSSKNINNLTLPEQIDELSHQNDLRQAFNKEKKIFQVSERLYQKKQRDAVDLPFQRIIEKGKQKFYIKKISRQSINYKSQKQKIKQISQILKPYVYNNNNMMATKRRESRTNLKSIRQRLSELSQSHKRYSVEGRQSQLRQMIKSPNSSKRLDSKRNSVNRERKISQDSQNNVPFKKAIGKDIIDVQHIIQSQFAYLKAVGFIDFIMKIGKENKKMVKAINKIQNEVQKNFKTPTEKDLELFGGLQETQNYIRGKNFWSIDSLKQNIMIYNKNDGLSNKVQRYFNLLKRANPELYGVLIKFLTDPIFAVYGKQGKTTNQISIASEDSCFVKDLFNQLQKYHKIKHNQCTHIVDFLEKIGFYRYTYF